MGSLTPEMQIIFVYHPEEGLGWTDLLPDRPRTTDVRIVLSPGGTVEGQVTLGGVAVEDSWVTVREPGVDGRVEGESFTDTDGAYSIKKIAEGLVSITAQLPRQGQASERALTRDAEIADGEVTHLTFNFVVTNIVVE